MNALEIIVALNALLNLAADAKINMAKLYRLRAKAEAENRTISAEELWALADDAQKAIDRLPE